jgi:surface protein with Ig-like domain
MQMRKILILSVIAAFAFVGCKKKANSVSEVVTVSYPKITINGPQYVSINVGGSFTPPTASAYDSFYKERPTVVPNLGSLNTSVAGLYTVEYSAKNQYGFVGTANLYVAVTNVSDSLDLSGVYIRNAAPNDVAFVTKVARGLFMTSNVGGDDTSTQASSVVPAVFAVTSSSTIDLGTQVTSAGTLTASSESLSLAPADTTYSYALSLSGFGTQVRTFVKQ